MTITTQNIATDRFQEQRGVLFGIAYRMLGSAADAEDVLQDAWLRYRQAGFPELDSPRAYLATVVTRLCLDRLKSARAQRESYFGEWLPDPVPSASLDWGADPAATADRRESISMAFLLLLERLSPLERAVLVLHEVAGYTHAEIAGMVDCSEVASRQHLRRARRRLARELPGPAPVPDAQSRRVAEAFVRALERGRVETMAELLAPTVVCWSDGGGKAAAAIHPLHGPDRVLRFLAGGVRKGWLYLVRPVEVNGGLGAALWFNGNLEAVLAVDATADGVTALRFVRNPDKLRFFATRLPAA